MSIKAALEALRVQQAELPYGPELADHNPFRLRSTLEGPAGREELEQAWPDRRLPSPLLEAWLTTRQARLFVDIDSGQGGRARP